MTVKIEGVASRWSAKQVFWKKISKNFEESNVVLFLVKVAGQDLKL